MKVNLICNLNFRVGDNTIDAVATFNEVVAWCLRESFKKVGVDAVFVNDNKLKQTPCPLADHSLVISATAMHNLRHTGGYLKRIRDATAGCVDLYLDSDMRGVDKWHDHVFTVVKPYPGSSSKYIYGGWGAEPTLFYPEQVERAVFVDSYMYGFYKGKYDYIYEKIENALSTIKDQKRFPLKVYQPFTEYGNRVRISWSEMAAIIRRCHFYIGTQPGESGLTRVEAATCGALLLIHPSIKARRTWALFNHRDWGSEEDLIEILRGEVNVEENRAVALMHTWGKVVARMLDTWKHHKT